jgi:Domain of unknown function (DUF4375)
VPGGDAFDEIERYYLSIDAQLEASWPTLNTLDDDDRAFAVLYVCSGEIENGGVGALFQNPSGDIAALLPEAAARFGLERHAALARDMLALMGSTFPTNFDERYEMWQRFVDETPDSEIEARINPVEQEWYARSDEIDRALAQYVERSASTE